MFNLKIFLVALFAVVATYLMLTIPMASATEVKIYWETTPGSTPIDTGVSQTLPSLGIARSLSLSGDTLTVSVYNTSSIAVDTVYVYKCKDKNPQQCSSETPEVYNPTDSNMQATYSWSAVKGASGNGNFMILVKGVKDGKSSWRSYWHTVTSTGADQSYDITEVRLVTSDLGKTENIRSYVQNWGMLPFSSAWGIVSAIFVGASSVFDLQSPTGPPALAALEVSGDKINKTISPVRQDYTYAVPSGAQTWNGITLFNNPTYTLNNGNCESSLGETYAVAGGCLDCPCPTGQYCDGVQGGANDAFVCRSTSGIRLEVVGTYGISDCSVSHNIDLVAQIPSRLETPAHPADFATQFPGKYTIHGISSDLATNAATTCTQRTDGRYTCPIIVPADPNCGGMGDYTMLNNQLKMDVTYWDGESQVLSTLTGSFNIGVGTYTCGGGRTNCEVDAGETEGNCCYDCACSTEGYYCDWDITSGTGSCKPKLTESSIQAVMSNVRKDPGRGSIADVTYSITPKPDSIQSLTITGCSTGCSPDCTATCTTGGCIEDSTETSYRLVCRDVSFLISDYDESKDYNLDPTFDAVLRYYDGPNIMTESFPLSTGPESLVSDYCGDSICSSLESNVGCCYDCPCDTGDFCSWDSTIAKEAGTCEPLDGVSISGAVLEDTSFDVATTSDGRTGQIVTNITFSISGAVYGFAGPGMGTSCEFDGNSEADLTGAVCSISSCRTSGPNRITCELTIPPIDYTVSNFYSRSQNRVVITPNTATVAIKLLDGSRARLDHYLEVDLPDITINPLGSCIMGSPCEEHLGETSENCCINCGCDTEGFVCIPGDRAESTCVNETEIVLVTDFPRIECWIAPYSISKGNCTFLTYTEHGTPVPRAGELNSTIYNAPADLDVERLWYTFQGEENEVINYIRVEDSIITTLALEDIPNAVPGTYERDFGIKAQVSYFNDAGSVVTTNITDDITFNFSVSATNETVICNAIVLGYDDEVKDLTKLVVQARHWGWGMVTVGTVLMILSIWCGYPCFIIGCIMAAVGLATVMFAYNMNQALQQLEIVADQSLLCTGTAMEYKDYENRVQSVNRAASMALIGSIVMAVGLILLCVAIGEAIDWSSGAGGEAGEAAGTGEEFFGDIDHGTPGGEAGTTEAIPETVSYPKGATVTSESDGIHIYKTTTDPLTGQTEGFELLKELPAGQTFNLEPGVSYGLFGNGIIGPAAPAAATGTGAGGLVLPGIILTTTGLTMTAGGMMGTG